MILSYHFYTSHEHHDKYDLLKHKSHVLKAIDVSCESGACDEKNDKDRRKHSKAA